ncbi:hypothetical protein WH47_01903 [Habropoda laboriosa]|uniref:Mos1 transposase HTH domain-containing protein n=1 Tax=Habropoda laboriosa TaxID=597456 RepID=A0A0L7QXZ5_9HYME|nr:hypothetical protein WH47_01903 [Habropoda laboriosa]
MCKKEVEFIFLDRVKSCKHRIGCTVENAVKDICDVYGKGVLSARKCQRWFSKFRNGAFDLSAKAVF